MRLDVLLFPVVVACREPEWTYDVPVAFDPDPVYDGKESRIAVGDRYTVTQRVAPANGSPFMVLTRGAFFIGIDVEGDKLSITLWRDGVRNAMYAPVEKDWALRRSLPQAIDEAIEFAQSAAGSRVTE